MRITRGFLALYAALVVGTLSLPAAASIIEDTNPMTGNSDQFVKYTFNLSAGSYLGQIFDFGTPADFSYLQLVVSHGTTTFVDTGNIKPADLVDKSFIVSPAQAGLFTAIVYGHPGNHSGFFGSQYHFEVDAIPEPAVWLLMIGGIGLLGWLRVRKTENM